MQLEKGDKVINFLLFFDFKKVPPVIFKMNILILLK